MNYYLDIKIVLDEEIPLYFIRNKIYMKLHNALYTLKSTNIGVSFPNYEVKLGDVIRLHGNKDSLEALQQSNWLDRLADYHDITDINVIPDKVKHRIVSRKQSNMTASKLRRLIKRGTINAEEAQQYKAKMFTKGLDNPYLELQSSSNGNKHRRYLQFSELLDKSTNGAFDQFGLSKTATIPWF